MAQHNPRREAAAWSALVLLLSPLVLAGFFAYTKVVSGLTPLEAEQLQMVHFALPWQGLIDALRSARAHPVALVNAAVVVLCAVGLVVMVVRRPRLPVSYIAYTISAMDEGGNCAVGGFFDAHGNQHGMLVDLS